jgi:MFS family permease
LGTLLGRRSRNTRNLGFLSPLSALAAAVLPFRPGTVEPASGTAFSGAPGAAAEEAHSLPNSRLRRSLRACTSEGLFAEIVNACAAGAVLTAWAIHLHAGPLLTGVVVALPQMAQLFQVPAAWTTSWLGHRRAAVGFVTASRQVVLPLAALPFLPVSQHTKQLILFAVAAFAAVLAILGNNAWVSWMGDLVPRRIRGRYFGQRTALCTMAGGITSAGVGLLLDWARPHGATGAMLAALQVAACAAGVVTTVLMMRQHDPTHDVERPTPSVADALAPLRDPSVRGLLRYVVVWNLAVGLAGSFFALFMLKQLRMAFALVALQGAGTAFSRMLAAPLWGRLIDRLGARPVMVACAFGIATLPLIWLFPTPTFLWPLAFDALFAGIFWGGHNLAMFVLPLTATPRRGRPHYVAAVATAGGAAFGLATIAGGALAQRLPAVTTLAGRPLQSLQVVFALSALARFGAAFAALRIHEPAAAGVGALFGEVLRRKSRSDDGAGSLAA